MIRTLLETGALPSVCGTRQSQKYTRQRLCRVPHSAKGTRQRINRQRSLCRVPEKHSAKIYTRQNENAKKPKNNSKNFIFGEGRQRPAPVRPAPPVIEVAVIFEQISRLMRLAGFELTTSHSCVCCSTTVLHCHLCLDSVIYPHILY